MARRVWRKVAGPGELAEGRVRAVACGTRTICLTHFEGTYGALDNRCPHQGGPLGEGSIEGGWLRCPWHGWDFHPVTGKSPGGYEDGIPTFEVEERPDGVYVALEEEEEHVRTASDVLAETLTRWGVDTVLGMVGHSNLGLADALRREEAAGRLRYIGIRHEGAAAFACSAYGKLTGRPAACLAIAGPGATNLLTGLWDAHVDRAPVVALTGQVPSSVLGRGAFQEVDLAGAFGSVAVYTGTLYGHSDPAELMSLACKHAIVDRGVSHLIFPDDFQTGAAAGVAAAGPEGRLAATAIRPPEPSLDAAAEAMRTCARPVIVVGHGARFDMPAIVALAETLGAPVLTTFKAKGQISDHHALGCGVLGRSGTPIASWFMNECDRMLVFGASFSNHTGITPKKPIVQVDLDRAALGRFHAVDVPVWGDAGVTARLLQERVAAGDAAGDARAEVAERWRIWRAEKARRRAEDRGLGMSSAAIFDVLSRTVPGDAIVPVDVGNNTYSFGRYFEPTGQTVLMSGYLGSIGFALPAALGAWAATQGADPRFAGRRVVSVSGDGGLGQYLGELTTLVRHRMNVVHVVLSNGELGKISKEQRAGEWEVWQTGLTNPDFAALAANCGALGLRADSPAALEEAMVRALACEGPALVEVAADPLLI